MIITKLVSGLGNQLFQYVVGRQLAYNNRTTLKLDITFFKEQNLRSFRLDKLNIKASLATDDEINNSLKFYQSNSLYAKTFRKFEKMLPLKKRHLIRESEWWTYEPNLLNAGSNTYLDGYWQHYKYFENIHPDILEEVTLKDRLGLTSTSVLNKVQSDEKSVSIHIRRGDYVSDQAANKLMGVLPIEYYSKAIECVKSKLSNPQFYIFSDDITWVKENLHLNEDVNYVDEGADYEEMYLMSNCNHNIIANSSFSWWAAYLNKAPEKIVIAPKNWVADSVVNDKIEIVFPSWIKL